MSAITPVQPTAGTLGSPDSTAVALDSLHENILDKAICLALNASWLPIGVRTVRQAVVALMSESNGEAPLLALDVQMNELGEMVYANPLQWEAWSELEVRPGDLYIQTKDRKIRAPTIVITRFFNKIPIKMPRLTRQSVLERDGYTCQYSGVKLPKHRLNVDHVLPRDRGGRDDWANVVACDKELNSRKGNKLNEEAGLKLIRQPAAPKGLPVSATIREIKRPEWAFFLSN